MEIQFRTSNPAEIHHACAQLPQKKTYGAVVCAGDTISTDGQEGFLRGHGTQADSDELRATQCGLVQRVNKLVSVQAFKQRYSAELGDVVVGRVVEIVGKKWKLDLHSLQDASLMLSAVNLPGGVQRRRTVEDELNMRAVFQEGDLISAEIQQLFGDGSVALHTRSTRYGKLRAGQLISVPSNLVPRQKKHLCSLPQIGVDLIIGVNGMIWVTSLGTLESDEKEPKQLSRQDHESISRAGNAIRALAKLKFLITSTSVSRVVEDSMKHRVLVVSMLHNKHLLSIIALESKQRQQEDDDDD